MKKVIVYLDLLHIIANKVRHIHIKTKIVMLVMKAIWLWLPSWGKYMIKKVVCNGPRWLSNNKQNFSQLIRIFFTSFNKL